MSPGPRLYAPLSAEHRFWLRVVPRFLAPTGEVRGVLRRLHAALVVPNVLFVSVSAEYQTYLALIFHQSKVARVGHVLCVPAGVVLMIATAARITPWLGVALGAVFCVWWAGVGLLHRRLLWAAVNATASLLLTIAGFEYARSGSGLVGPALLMLLVAALQSASHATESHLPPRVVSDRRWTELSSYLASRSPARVLRVARAWAYGAFDEWWATPRLVHVGTLLMLFRFGYAPELRARLESHVNDAIASGDPALDYIGEGGGTYLDPRTLEPRA